MNEVTNYNITGGKRRRSVADELVRLFLIVAFGVPAAVVAVWLTSL